MNHPTSVFIRLSKVPGLDRAGLLSEMAQVSIQSAGWLPACLVRTHHTNNVQVSHDSFAQVVNLRWEDGDEEHKQELWNIQLDGSGRLKWAAVKKAFGADLVEIEDEGTPALLEDGEWKGFTIDTFQPGSTILVTVSRKAQGEDRATGQTVTHVPLQLSDPL